MKEPLEQVQVVNLNDLPRRVPRTTPAINGPGVARSINQVSWLNSDILSAIFRQQVLEMMVQKRRLSFAFAHKISHWRHSGGFQVYCSQTVQADDRQALERLAAYILRPSFAATRLRYQPNTGQVQYRTALRAFAGTSSFH